jgi:tRNA uridine 5-carbamoylmethylation protein Kti12
MNIANNILKHNLKNVYFLSGTACGGKTTMAKELSKKYGFYHYDDNYHTDDFLTFDSICNKVYQPACAKQSTRNLDWDGYFNRSVEEADKTSRETYLEYLEYALIDLIKLSKDNFIIADLHLPISLAKEITDYNKVAFLVTNPENVVKDYYKRDDHSDIYDLIMTLKDPQKSLDNLHAQLEYGTKRVLAEIYRSNMFYITRDENSTVENTLLLLEKHFGLNN